MLLKNLPEDDRNSKNIKRNQRKVIGKSTKSLLEHSKIKGNRQKVVKKSTKSRPEHETSSRQYVSANVFRTNVGTSVLGSFRKSVPEKCPESFPEHIPEKVLGRVSEKFPRKVPGKFSGKDSRTKHPEGSPDNSSRKVVGKRTGERLPESLIRMLLGSLANHPKTGGQHNGLILGVFFRHCKDFSGKPLCKNPHGQAFRKSLKYNSRVNPPRGVFVVLPVPEASRLCQYLFYWENLSGPPPPESQHNEVNPGICPDSVEFRTFRGVDSTAK